MNIKIVFSIFSLLIVTLTMLIWSQKFETSNSYEYITKTIESRKPMEEIIVTGTLRLENETEHYFGCDGSIKKVLVKSGDRVSKGQMLASEVCPSLTGSYDEKMEELVKLEKQKIEIEKQIESIDKLQKVGYYSRIEAFEEKTKLINLISKLSQIEEQNKKALAENKAQYIFSDNDGVVMSVNIREGMKNDGMRAKEPAITTSSSLAKPLVLLEVQDFNINSVEIGQNVEIHLPGNFEKSYHAGISAINIRETDDIRKRFYLVTAVLENNMEDFKNFKSGMKVESVITTSDEKELLWIPRAAVEIELPEQLVSQELNLIKNEIQKSGLAVNKKGDINQGVISRSIASTLKAETKNNSTIYLVNSSNKVTKVSIAVEKVSRDFVGVKHFELAGQNVITHYKAKTNWMKELSF